MCRRERARGERPPPNLAPGPQGLGALFFFASRTGREVLVQPFSLSSLPGESIVTAVAIHDRHFSQLHPLTLSLFAGVMGFAANAFTLPVFGGAPFIFGGFFVFLATFCLGPIWGTFTAVIAFSRITLEAGYGAGTVCWTFEALVTGWLVWERGWRPLKAVVAFWLFLGTPLVAAFIATHDRFPFPVNWAVAIKFPLNSIIVALAALPAAQCLNLRWPDFAPPALRAPASLRRMLFERFSVLAALLIVILTLMAGNKFDEARRHDATSDLLGSVTHAASLVNAHLGEHRRMIATLASQISADQAPQPADLHAEIEAVRRRFPGFLTLLVADAKGEILAASTPPRWRAGPDTLRATNVADRDYFKQAVATRAPFVSNVFQGRGLGRDLIVAISAPVLDRDQNIRYVIEGSLNLRAIFDAIAAAGIQANRNLVVTDRANRLVIVHGDLVGMEALSTFHTHPLYVAAREAGALVYQTDARSDSGHRSERYLASHITVPEFGWHIYLAEPIWRSQKAIAGFYASTLLWAAFAVGVALILARQTAGSVTQPLASLLEATSRLATRDPVEPRLSTVGAPIEIARLSQDVHAAALSLRRIAREREEANAQLHELNRSLDAKVLARTTELHEARLAAEAANQAKSGFLANMSHELRTPLNVVLGMTELLAEQRVGPMNDTQRDCLHSVDESARHLLSLINDVLDLSKIEADKMQIDTQPVRIVDVCEASLRMIREIAVKKNLNFTAEYRQTADQVLADPRRLKQMLVNLLSNAAKFTPDGGRGGIVVTQVDSPPDIVFTVWDTGIGISAENLSRLFEPFVQIDSALSRRYNGTGLGLALVKRMAHLQAGTIAVESTPDEGSRFKLALPSVTEPPLPVPLKSGTDATRVAPPLPIPGSPLILLAEDNGANVSLIRIFARMHGCRLTVASNGIEAIARARVELPDLILMDVNMPDMDGLEATSIISREASTRHIPIVCLTANAMPEDRDRCLVAGAVAYLSKPVDLHHLAETIRNVLAGRTRPPAPVA